MRRPAYVLAGAVLAAMCASRTSRGDNDDPPVYVPPSPPASSGPLLDTPGAPERGPPPSANLDYLGPADPPYFFEAAALAGFASAPIRGAVNPFGTGAGARAGVNLSHLYVGGSVMDYLGGSDTGATDQALLAGLELGYNARLGRHVVLRPLVGLGDAMIAHTEPGRASSVDVVSSASGGSATTTGAIPPVTTTVNNFYVEPELTALFTYHRFFAALGFGVLFVPSITYGPSPAQETTWISYAGQGQLGFRL